MNMQSDSDRVKSLSTSYIRVSDKIMEAQRLVELIEMAVRYSPENDHHALSAGCVEALDKIRKAVSILEDCWMPSDGASTPDNFMGDRG